MPEIVMQIGLPIGAVSLAGRPKRFGEQTVTYEPLDNELTAPGRPGSLTTRVVGGEGDDAGEVTLSGDHGIQTSDVVDIYWSAGVRYGMVAAVAGNVVTVTGGAGDVLPVQGTSVVCSLEVVRPFSFEGDHLVVLGMGGNRRSLVQLQQSNGTVHLAADIPGEEIYPWIKDTGVANPVSGDTIAHLVYSNGDPVQTLRMKAGALLDV